MFYPSVKIIEEIIQIFVLFKYAAEPFLRQCGRSFIEIMTYITQAEHG